MQLLLKTIPLQIVHVPLIGNVIVLTLYIAMNSAVKALK